MSWNPSQYQKFQSVRAAPFEDLVRWLEVRPHLKVVDLGCGTGELTARLADLLPNCNITGIDSSPAMLERARPLERPELQFKEADLQKLDGEYDLIFSHAALHWVPDQRGLISRLWARLRSGGQLLVQVPANFYHASHRLAEVAAKQVHPAAPALSELFGIFSLEQYGRLLFQLGAADVQLVQKIYPQVFPSVDSIVDWTKGTMLNAYLDRLPEASHGEFLALYSRLLDEELDPPPVYYGFLRTLISARKPS